MKVNLCAYIVLCTGISITVLGCDSTDENAESVMTPVFDDSEILFIEDFEDEIIQEQTFVLNFEEFSGVSVDSGSVDLLDGMAFGVSCALSSGGCIDLDGTNQASTDEPASIISTDEINLIPGLYTLNFDLSGSQRGSTSDTLELEFGVFINDVSLTVAASEPYVTHEYIFEVAESGAAKVTFTLTGLNDQTGPILDNIIVRRQ